MNHIEITESLEIATETIVAKMATCEFYGSLYLETMQLGLILSSDQMTRSLQQSLDSALPEFYAAVLVFSVKARQYFDPANTGKEPPSSAGRAIRLVLGVSARLGTFYVEV